MSRLVTLIAILLVVADVPSHAGSGKKMYKEFVANNQLYPDERWQQYVRDIGARVLEHTPDAGKDYHFHVLDGDEVNAFATGDAYIFVSRGLLAFLESEDQLAAVIGHEIGHVVAKHVRKRRVTDIAGKSAGAIAAIVTGRGEMMRDVFNPLTALWVSGYGREMELEADRLGGEFMAKAGYNPEAIIDTVWVLKDQQVFAKEVAGSARPYHGVFATHPRNDRRLHDAVAYARGLAPDELEEPIGDFMGLIDGVAYGDEAAGGLVKDETYYHGGLRVVVKFPDGWSVAAPQSQVTGIAPGGTGEGSITVARHEMVKRKTPEKYVTDVLRRDDVQAGEEREINGAPAFVGEIDTSESDVALQLIAVLYVRKNVFLFKGECGDECDPDQFRGWFEETLAGLRPMTADDVQLANSRRIQVIVAEPGQTYASLAGLTSLREFPEQTLRLLNADYPNGEPRAGDLVKIVK